MTNHHQNEIILCDVYSLVILLARHADSEALSVPYEYICHYSKIAFRYIIYYSETEKIEPILADDIFTNMLLNKALK